MCIGGGGSSGPAVDPEAEAEQARQREANLQERKDRKQEALGAAIEATQRGTGRRSLISGPGGGMGYFNRYRT